MSTKPKAQTQSFGNKLRQTVKAIPSTANGFLSMAFLKLLEKRLSLTFDRVDHERRILERWNALVNTFLKDPRNAIPQTKEALSAARGNIYKEMIKEEMTWKVFLKSARLMQGESMTVTFTVHLPDGQEISYRGIINLGPTIEHDSFDGPSIGSVVSDHILD